MCKISSVGGKEVVSLTEFVKKVTICSRFDHMNSTYCTCRHFKLFFISETDNSCDDCTVFMQIPVKLFQGMTLRKELSSGRGLLT